MISSLGPGPWAFAALVQSPQGRCSRRHLGRRRELEGRRREQEALPVGLQKGFRGHVLSSAQPPSEPTVISLFYGHRRPGGWTGYNLQGTVKNANAGPLVQQLGGISGQGEPSIKPAGAP